MRHTIDQLRAFVAAAEEGSFSGAARRLGRAQSSVSQSVMNLEIDWGVDLFDREGRFPVLTPQGEGLLKEARLLLRRSEELDRRAAAHAGETEARLTFVEDELVPLPFVFALLKDFERRFPDVELDILFASPQEAERMIRSGRADIGATVFLDGEPEGLSLTRIMDMEFVHCCSPEHPLAALRDVTRADLESHRQLVLSGSSGSGRIPSDAHGILRWASNSYYVVHQYACEGHGWAVLPRFMVEQDLAADRLRLLEVPGGTRRMPLHLATRAEPTFGPAADWLVRNLASVRLEDLRRIPFPPMFMMPE